MLKSSFCVLVCLARLAKMNGCDVAKFKSPFIDDFIKVVSRLRYGKST